MLTDQTPMVIAFILIIISTVMIFLSSWAFKRRKKVAGALELSLFLFASGFYISGYAIEITSSTLGEIFWALKIEYIGLPFITVSVLFLAVRLTTQKAVPMWGRLLLTVIPVIVICLVYTLGRHSLYFRAAVVSNSGAFPVLKPTPGPWSTVFFLYNLGLTIISELLFIRGAVKSEGIKRKQMLLVLFGGLFPLITKILIPERFRGIDLLPFSLMLSGIFIAIALFKFHMLELLPRALDIAVDSIDEMLLLLDPWGHVRELNSSARSSSLFENTKVGDSLPKDTPIESFFSGKVQGAVREKDYFNLEFEYADRNYDLKVYNVAQEFTLINGWVMIIRDITESVRLINELEHQAIYDELTCLFNRRHIMSLAAREVELARRSGANIGVILIDIDKFKLVNDSFGHLAGDRVLKACADTLSSAMRVSDLIGRYGGEEFIIICPNSDLSTSLVIAERLRKALELMNVSFNGQIILTTASFGVESVTVAADTGLDELLAASDKALYKAKRLGRNRVEAV